jgi:hypothetical protein
MNLTTIIAMITATPNTKLKIILILAQLALDLAAFISP